MKFLLFLALVGIATGQIKHNLPDDVEIVDPKSLGFDESQIDLSSILGNVKLQPVVSNHDPKTGLKTQVLTVGFENEDNLNLDDFELPSNGNNSELVQNAFNSFKEYVKSGKPTVTRRRKVVKKVEKPQPTPKVVELDSAQIEKLLATGKLKSKKVGDSSVIEITQEQLNDLYGGEFGGEFRELLGGEIKQVKEEIVQPVESITQQPITTTTTTEQIVQTTPQTISQTTLPPIVYEFNTKDLHNQQYVSYQPIKQFPQKTQQITQFPQKTQQITQFPQKTQQITQFPQKIYQFPQQQPQKSQQKPTFEFISVPPVSQYTSQINPIPSNRGRVIFPPSNRFHRSPLNTFYSDDGLNYKDNNNSTNDYLRGV